MRNFWHRVSHFFGWNTGRVVTFWVDDVLYVGFRCDHCGEISGAYATDRVRVDWQSPMPSLERPVFPVKVSEAK